MPDQTVPTVPSPLALCEGLEHRAVLGPVQTSADGTCASRAILCVTCGGTGRQSDNLKLRKGKL